MAIFCEGAVQKSLLPLIEYNMTHLSEHQNLKSCRKFLKFYITPLNQKLCPYNNHKKNLTIVAYLSALYLYNSESGFNKEIEKSSEITLIAPSMDKYSVKQE